MEKKTILARLVEADMNDTTNDKLRAFIKFACWVLIVFCLFYYSRHKTNVAPAVNNQPSTLDNHPLNVLVMSIALVAIVMIVNYCIDAVVNKIVGEKK